MKEKTVEYKIKVNTNGERKGWVLKGGVIQYIYEVSNGNVEYFIVEIQ